MDKQTQVDGSVGSDGEGSQSVGQGDGNKRKRVLKESALFGFMQQIDSTGVMYVRWNKNDYPDGPQHLSFCLFFLLEFYEWRDEHPEWWNVGEWDKEQYGFPHSVTELGKAALALAASPAQAPGLSNTEGTADQSDSTKEDV